MDLRLQKGMVFIMNSRKLSAWLLIIGPIVIFSAFIGWPNVETAQEELTELAKKPATSIAIMGLFITGITLLFTGLSISSRMIGEGTTNWASLSVVSGTLFPLTIAVMVISVGLNFGAVRLYETSVENANAIYLIAYHITDVIGLIMGISFVCLGTALLVRYEDLFRRIIGALYIGIGICHLVGIFLQDNNVLGIVAWIGMFIVSIAFGVAVFRDQSKE